MGETQIGENFNVCIYRSNINYKMIKYNRFRFIDENCLINENEY